VIVARRRRRVAGAAGQPAVNAAIVVQSCVGAGAGNGAGSATATEVGQPDGKPRAPRLQDLPPTNCHRASSRPYSNSSAHQKCQLSRVSTSSGGVQVAPADRELRRTVWCTPPPTSSSNGCTAINAGAHTPDWGTRPGRSTTGHHPLPEGLTGPWGGGRGAGGPPRRPAHPSGVPGRWRRPAAGAPHPRCLTERHPERPSAHQRARP